MATAHGVSSINLLPKDSFEFSSTGKLLKWITTSGRVLVVLTEFVVLLAFGSRFYFDKKLDDLGEVIVQKQAQIMAYSDVEGEMRIILAKQLPIETSINKGLDFSEKIDNLTSVLPTGVAVNSLSLDENGLNFSARAMSEYGFAQFVTGVKKMPNVATIALKETTFDQTTGEVIFSIQVTFK